MCSRDAVRSRCSMYKVASTGPGTWAHLIVNSFWCGYSQGLPRRGTVFKFSLKAVAAA